MSKDWQGHRNLEIKGNKVQCPWWKKKVGIWDDPGCLSQCEYCKGTYQGQGIHCTYQGKTTKMEDPNKLSEHSQTVTLMLPIRPEVGKQIVSDRPGRIEFDDLHCTLIFLGELAYPNLTLQIIENLVWRICQEFPPLKGKLNGTGHFVKKEKGIPFYTNFDCKDLPKFRQALVDELEISGIVSPSEHGYTPHITLFYYEGPTPNIEVPSLEIEFDAVRIQWGDENFDIPFGGREYKLGSAKSGFKGHKGRPGRRGGSAPRGGAWGLNVLSSGNTELQLVGNNVRVDYSIDVQIPIGNDKTASYTARAFVDATTRGGAVRIVDIFTDDKIRGRGIATALVGKIVEYAKQQGLSEVQTSGVFSKGGRGLMKSLARKGLAIEKDEGEFVIPTGAGQQEVK